MKNYEIIEFGTNYHTLSQIYQAILDPGSDRFSFGAGDGAQFEPAITFMVISELIPSYNS